MNPTTANNVITTTNHEFSSQLDSIETSIHHQLPSSYQDYRLDGLEDEWKNSIGLYARADQRDNKNRATNLLECRKYAWFYYNEKTGRVRCVANACRLRWCPICSRARFNLIRHSVQDWLQSVRNPKLLTVTLRHNSLSLSQQVSRLYTAFRNFRRHKNIRLPVRGGIWFFQVTRGKGDGDWHVHFHILLDSDFIPKQSLSLEWLIATGDSFIVDIRKINEPEKVSEYVARYCSRPAKLSEFSETDQDEMFNTLHGKRLYGSFGTGHNCRLQTQKTQDYNDWIKIGSWSDIINNVHTDKNCKAIARAFFVDGIVDSSVAYSVIPDWLRVKPLTIRPAVLEDKQLTFSYLFKGKKDEKNHTI